MKWLFYFLTLIFSFFIFPIPYYQFKSREYTQAHQKGYAGFFKYVVDGWYMIYNPTTKIISHIQPLK